MHHPSYASRFYHPQNIGWRVHKKYIIEKVSNMALCVTSCLLVTQWTQRLWDRLLLSTPCLRFLA
jgi:hypothetical protein